VETAQRQRRIKLGLFLVSLALSTMAFLSFDWVYSAADERARKAPGLQGSCRVPDPVRIHGLKPNCACVDSWGTDSYQFFTNSLGFRDEKIREVPLADASPRILMLGDSFTEAPIAWSDSYVGRIAAHLPQYHFLNGGVGSYSTSNYLNTARMVLARGVDIDEVIVFLDISDVQYEASYYRDVDASGAVTGPKWTSNLRSYLRKQFAKHFVVSNDLLEFFEWHLLGKGHYYLTVKQQVDMGFVFDADRSAWTYRKVSERYPWPGGFAPLGVEGGIAREKAKMDLLWQELHKRNIPISVVVYPYPAQVVHDTADSRQVRIWRDWCEGKCKRFISLFPAFLEVKDQCPPAEPDCWYKRYFVFGDFHYNAAGNALVADGVIKSLTEEPPVKRPGAGQGAPAQ